MIAPIIFTKGARQKIGEYDVDMSQTHFCSRCHFRKHLLHSKSVVQRNDPIPPSVLFLIWLLWLLFKGCLMSAIIACSITFSSYLNGGLISILQPGKILLISSATTSDSTAGTEAV